MDHKTFDVEKLRIASAVRPAAKAERIPRSQNYFLKLPDIWDDTLTKIPDATAATYRIANILVRKGWRSRDHKVKLTNELAASVNVTRWAKYRAVEQLRKAGLIAVEDRVRRSPMVTVRHLSA